MRKTIVLVLLCCSFYQYSHAQCSITQLFANNTFSANMSDEVAQSFKACSFANIDSLKIRIASLSMATVNLSLKINEGGNTSGSVIHTQTVPVSSTGDLTIIIDKAVPLSSGKPYTFSLTWASAGTISFSDGGASDMYPDGVSLINNIPSVAGADLYFAVYQGKEIFIPTMSQWGLFIFGLLLVNFSLMFMHHLQSYQSKVAG